MRNAVEPDGGSRSAAAAFATSAAAAATSAATALTAATASALASAVDAPCPDHLVSEHESAARTSGVRSAHVNLYAPRSRRVERFPAHGFKSS